MIDRLLHQPKTTVLARSSVFTLSANIFATYLLNASYYASGFPVPYQGAQLSFSAPRLKGWYAQLIDFGKLDV